MRFLTLSLFIFSTCFLSAQGYEDKVKLLGQHGVPYFYNADVAANIEKWKENENNATSDVLGRSVMWFQEMEIARKTHGLPWFIRFIPAANTGYSHLFEGKDGSKGMWPLDFSIAKKYGLMENSFTDMRRDVEASSEAACRYLADLNNIYKDWLKTITAFRIGAIRLNQVIRLAGNSLDFNDIYQYLSPEEREPILQFYAAVTVMYYRHDFHLQETVFPKMSTDTVNTQLSLPFPFLEDKLALEPGTLRACNPQFTRDFVPCFIGTTWFRIPSEKKQRYLSVKDSFLYFLEYKESPVEEPSDTSVVSTDIAPAADTVATVHDAAADTVQTFVWVWYRIKSGDGFYTLSDIFDCSIEDMKLWNGIRNNDLIANRLIKFYVPANRVEYYKGLNTMNMVQKRQIAQKD